MRGSLGLNETSSYERRRKHLTYRKLDIAAESLSPELDRATKENLSATQLLEPLLELGVEATQARRQRGRLRWARPSAQDPGRLSL